MAIDPNSPTVLATLPNESEAVLLCDYLISHGIKAHIAGIGGWVEVRLDVQVIVRQADFAQAKELLAQIGDSGPESSH